MNPLFRRSALASVAAAVSLAWAQPSDARVTKIIIDSPADYPNSHNLLTGQDIQYETVTGRAFGELDPNDPHNAIISDIALARKLNGKVEYIASFFIVKPVNMSQSSGLMWHDVPNRSGTNQPLNVMGNPIPYFPANSADNSDATLTVHLHETLNGVITVGDTIPNSQWKFCYGTAATFAAPGSPTSLPVRICLDGSTGLTFNPTRLYEVVYTATNPYVLGAGTAAFRDVASFFRRETADDFGNPNPLAGTINAAIIRGSSQSGNF